MSNQNQNQNVKGKSVKEKSQGLQNDDIYFITSGSLLLELILAREHA